MLRLTVLLLVLANAMYFAWSQGLLAPIGIAPAQQSEAQRLEQQIKPQSLRILDKEEASRLEVALPGTKPLQECLQAGPLEDAQVALLKQVLGPWPDGSWVLESGIEPAHWIVYIGKYASAENVSRKKAELRQIGVSFEALSDPALEPGLSLGGFATEAAARQHMEALSQRGVRSAKVLRERAEQRAQWVKFPAVDDGLRPRLEDLRPALNGKNLRPCR
jgi:SPOR domain